MSGHVRTIVVVIATGAAVGAVILGVGGRVAMHAFALATAGVGGFTFGGTMTVVGAGAAFGVLAAVLYAAARLILPRRRPARGLLFAALFAALCVPGIRPPRPLTFLLFVPLLFAAGLAIERTLEPRLGPDSRPR
jgi:hypothetical protein